MAKCDLRIDIDGDRRTYHGGEKISGTLTVRVNAKCQCNGLTLTRLWRTHGRGNRSQGSEQTKDLFKGEWQAGQTFAYPFEFTVPHRPLTYHGHLLNIDWYIVARADIPWAIDPKAEEEFFIEPEEWEPKTKVEALPGQSYRQEFKTPGRYEFWILVFFIAFLALMGPVGWVIAVIGLIIAFAGFNMWSRFAQRKIGNVIIEVSPSSLSPGETLTARISFVPRKNLRLNKVVGVLTAKEVVVSGSGTHKTTHTHTLLEEDVRFLGKGNVAANRTLLLEKEIRLSSEAPPSFSAPSNNLNWSFDYRVDIPRWPDWTRSVELQVSIPRAERPAGSGVEEAEMALEEVPQGVYRGESLPEEMSERVERVASTSLQTSAPSRLEEPRAVAAASVLPPPFVEKDPFAPPEPEQPGSGKESEPDLGAILQAVRDASSFGDERQKLIASAMGQSFFLTLRVGRVERTTSLDCPEHLRGGQTVIGRMEGLFGQELAIRFPQERKDEARKIKRGSDVEFRAVLTGWDDLFERAELELMPS